MRQSDIDFIQRELEAVHSQQYVFGGMRIYHNGNVDIERTEKFYRNAPYYVAMLLARIRQLEGKQAQP